eukprot:TRINITY_DN11208_c0_g1_i2.p1 TRINITY_DN11208_c0_g1~~TRINITY_DN11208_c0_g1_i2.p1  ORF type:complete len:873 (+),score=297.02 TRINITY_DN11208_c0_g1_i2:71-2689(+)
MASRHKDEDAPRNPFLGLEKSTVLQEARQFNEMPINVRKCLHVLTKLLFLVNQGDTFGTREATETFFSMTKLFQCPDVTLRRMVYLTIKAMSTISEDVIMVTSSLMKDMTGKDDSYRGPAIRALCTITDSTTLQSLERFLKQAIVDRNASVSSAALVSSLHLLTQGQDVVKRWVNEVQQAAANSSSMAQYHALGLLYHIKQKDRLAVQKLVATQTRKHQASPFAACLLIRYAVKVMEQDKDADNSDMYDFLESCLRHKHEMVVYEAARAIVNIPNVTARQVAPAVSVLQLFLGSPRPVLRFAAARTLNKVSISHPNAVKTCVLDMENLITDSNRSVATLAITTLLKIGTESSVDRLMKQISSFISEISDEFKIVVVEAIRALCLKYPQKYPVLMKFLSDVLRDEGGYDYKKAIVAAISGIIEHVPEAKENGLTQLCEYIEDCEHPSLLTTILHMLGERGPTTAHPSKYIRFIYNRLILENSLVRAAAVDALAKFGSQCEDIKDSVVVLLKRCLMDGDDEVRDRVTFALTVLEGGDVAPVVNQLPLSLSSLERALKDYMDGDTTTAFDIKTVPVETTPTNTTSALDDMFDPVEPELLSTPTASVETQRAETETRLNSVPELAALGLGPLFRTSGPSMLTESETEYVVKAYKHIFAERVVFEYAVTNTLNDQVLEDVSVSMEGGEQEIDEDDIVVVKADKAAYDAPCSTYVSFPLDPTISSQEFATCLEFIVKDCDPETGETDPEGYDDKYELEAIELGFADYVQPVVRPNFAQAWQALEGAEERDSVFELSNMESIEEAITQVMDLLGLAACEKSDKVNEGKLRHDLFLSGMFVGGHEILVRAKMAFDDGVNMELAIRSNNGELSDLVLECIA